MAPSTKQRALFSSSDGLHSAFSLLAAYSSRVRKDCRCMIRGRENVTCVAAAGGASEEGGWEEIHCHAFCCKKEVKLWRIYYGGKKSRCFIGFSKFLTEREQEYESYSLENTDMHIHLHI